MERRSTGIFTWPYMDFKEQEVFEGDVMRNNKWGYFYIATIPEKEGDDDFKALFQRSQVYGNEVDTPLLYKGTKDGTLKLGMMHPNYYPEEIKKEIENFKNKEV